MDLRRSGGARAFDDVDPLVEWKQAGADHDVVEIALPGFRKDQVRVQVDNHGVLRATGERPVRGGRWARFTKDLQLPKNCDADAVRARFEGERLIITLPIAAAEEEAPVSPGFETPSSPPPPGPARPSSPPPRRAEVTKAEPKPSPSSQGTPSLQERPISVQPPSPMPPKQGTKAPEEAGKVSKRSPEEKKKERRKREKERGEVRGLPDEAVTDGTPSSKKKKRADELMPAMGGAPTATMAPPDPERQLVVNTVVAAAVLVGIIVAVWNTLRS
ncbi:hypothetical protein EJB05_00205, partial [Eragrostis curvula]